MSSDQLPPPLANFSFPPDNSGLQFNVIDSFVTSWVTPESSQGPCFLSLYNCNISSPGEPWISKFNQSVSLNSTEIVPLNIFSSGGLGQLGLNYVDPVGGHKIIKGAIFNVNYDPQPKAMTWNQNALSSSTTSSSSATSSSATSSAILIPTPASSTTTAPPSLTTPYPQTADTPALPSTSTATSSPAKISSSSHGAEIASITLGTILGVVFAAALLVVWIRRKREQRTSKQAVRMPSTVPVPVHNRTTAMHEKDTEVVLPELGSGAKR